MENEIKKRNEIRNYIKSEVNHQLSKLESDPEFIEFLLETGPFGWKYKGKKITFSINLGAG